MAVQEIKCVPKTGFTDVEEKKFNWFLYRSGLTANLLLVTFGILVVWSSAIIPKLQSSDPDINPLGVSVTTVQISIMASLTQLASPVGLILMAHLADKIGRKRTMKCVAIGFILASGIIAFSRNIYVYYFGFFVYGTTMGCTLGVVPVYNGEIASNYNRGKLGSIMGLGIPTGTFLGYLMSSVTTVRSYFLSCSVLPLFHLVLSTAIPESPVSLAAWDEKLKALEALEKLRGTTNSRKLEREYKEIEDALTKKRATFLDLFRNAASKKALLVSFCVTIVQQFSGIFVILFFLGPIFNEIGTNFSGDTVGAVVGLEELSVYLISLHFIDRSGRKILLVLSSLSSAIPMFFMGVYYHLKDTQSIYLENVKNLPVVCVVLFILCYGVGLGPVPIALFGELFSNDLRAVGVASVLIFGTLITFSIVFSFPLLQEAIGAHWCMWFFAFSNLIGGVVLYFTLPETKGKSFSEIQRMLSAR